MVYKPGATDVDVHEKVASGLGVLSFITLKVAPAGIPAEVTFILSNGSGLVGKI
jgi:hypothetical protein